jgi:stress response protein YsnF
MPEAPSRTPTTGPSSSARSVSTSASPRSRPARRGSASGRAAAGDLAESREEIVIPVKEERVTVSKQPVVIEEVSVGERKVQDTHHVAQTVRKEELDVDREGDVKIQGRGHSRS